MLELVDQMESAGILVLTPDEYMAALNPETMIEFATPLLDGRSSFVGPGSAGKRRIFPEPVDRAQGSQRPDSPVNCKG